MCFRAATSSGNLFWWLLNLESDDWCADAEIMIRAKQAGLSIGEIPVHFALNETRSSFVKPRAIFEFAANLIRYRFGNRKSPLRSQTSRKRPEAERSSALRPPGG